MRKFIRFLQFSVLATVALGATAAFVTVLYLNRGLPSIDSLRNYEPKELTQVYSQNGEVIGEYFEERRIVVEDIPRIIKDAFIAAEDAAFYTHKGVDFFGILRAAWANLRAGGIRQGASTITQQVAKALLLSPERTYTRKIKEAILAWRIEQSLTKDQILNLYLNHIYLGHSAYGVAAAAEVYFGKKLYEVQLSEAAILAGLPQAPSRYSPARNPDRVKRRQLYVLRQMQKAGFISDHEYETAANATVYIEPRVNKNKTIAPYFVEYLRQYLMKKYGSRMILQDGLKVYTTLDVDMNRYARNALRKGLSALEKRQGYRGPLRSLEKDEISEYFEGRRFEERDEAGLKRNEALEVDVSETEGRGEIQMKPAPPIELGDFIEGVVIRVDDEKEVAIVEYLPGYFAQLTLESMSWATERQRPDDEDQIIRPVRKVSDVLKVGDVVVISAKNLNVENEELNKEFDGNLIDAELEQDTEVEGALLSVDPRNGYVYAMIGGYDFNRSEFNRAVQAKRQPGSSFKPIIYITALDKGFTPASILQDSPITFENQTDQGKWRPNNYDKKFVGDTTLRSSLLSSRNITTIKLLNAVGLDSVVRYARRLGIESPLTRDFTLALGSSEVTLDEIIKPYIVLANQGYPRSPVFIRRIVDRDGNVLEQNVNEDFEAPILSSIDRSLSELKTRISGVTFSETTEEVEESASFLQDVKPLKTEHSEFEPPPLKPGQVLSSETSFLITHLLRENILYGSGVRARDLKHPAAGKTGTTDDNRDAWFLGFTKQLVTGVWVGYDDRRRLGRFETGGRAAVPIWAEYMIKASQSMPKEDFKVPEDIEFARIDPKTGKLAPSSAKSAVFEAFLKGTAPTTQAERSTSTIDLYQRED